MRRKRGAWLTALASSPPVLQLGAGGRAGALASSTDLPRVRHSSEARSSSPRRFCWPWTRSPGLQTLFFVQYISGCSLRFVAAIYKRHRPAPCINHHLGSAPDRSGPYWDLGPSHAPLPVVNRAGLSNRPNFASAPRRLALCTLNLCTAAIHFAAGQLSSTLCSRPMHDPFVSIRKFPPKAPDPFVLSLASCYLQCLDFGKVGTA